MLLKKIELKGFKSFADRTVIDFGQGITCIVGPNGSGKSNVTDAFRWVLGEQRFKTLRGAQMLDVVFNGTTKRKPLGFAEVAITFDNSAGHLPIEYTEVTVVRRLFRSGESEYAINGNKCRLKDVKELFMDTGVGVEGYSIIGQGRIESILSTNKEERRLILEEAAGIVKYRTRKEEAQRKLDRTGQNLERIEDIVKELSERVGPLKDQSEKAKAYLQYSESLKDLEINLFIHEVEQVDGNLKILVDELTDKEKHNYSLKTKLEMQLDQLAGLEELLAQSSARERQLSMEQQHALQEATQLKHDMDINRERRSLIETNIAQLKSQAAEDESHRLEAIDALEREQQTLALEKSQYDILFMNLERAQEEIDALAEVHDALAMSQQALEGEIEGLRAAHNQHLMTKEKLQLQMENLRERTILLKQESSLFEERQSQAVKQLSDAQHQLGDADEGLRAIEVERITLQDKQRDLQDNLSRLEEQIYHKRSELTGLEAKYRALVEQENQQEGFSYAVKQVLDWSKTDSDVYGCVKDLFTVDKQFEVAVETALGRNLQNIIVAHEDAVDQYIESLKVHKAGRATFMPLKGLEPREIPQKEERPGYFGCAVHHIKANSSVLPALQYLLSNVYFCEGLSDAKRAAKHLPKGSRVVTLEGEVVNVGGTVTGGSLSKKETGFLKRKREIQELSIAIEAMQQEIHSDNATRNDLQEALLESRKAFDASDARIAVQKQLVNDCKLKLDQVRQAISTASQGKGKLQEALSEIDTQISELQEEQTIAATEALEAESQLGDALSRHAAQREALNTHRSKQEAAFKVTTDLRVEEARAKEILSSLERGLVERQARFEHQMRQAQRRESDLLNLSQTIISLEAQLLDKQELLEAAKALQLALETEYVEVQRIVEGYRTHMQGIALEVENYRNQVGSFNDAIFRLEIDKTKLETRRDNILQNLFEKYELSFGEALGMKHEFDLKEYASEARRLKGLIKALGDVNVGAIKEYDTVAERYEFLSGQKEDLIIAKDQLSKLIREMDKEMRQSFKDKLEEINGFFKETFASLFGGGFGEITAEGDEDILEAEIVIHAQPPGKKLQSLDLMSGGEKALTAIALLFAILRTKPSPFCILDEIEAALDDVNIFRFASFLKDYVKNSQFIIITHRKGTMEIAQSLFGVTMQEQGVSTVISVQLDENYDNLIT